jgi:sugar diacid utilization regulator
MKATAELTVRSFSETEEEILRLTEKSAEGMIRKEGILFLRAGNRIFSCEDTAEGRRLMEAVSGETQTGAAGHTEESFWKKAIRGTADLNEAERFGIQDDTPRCVILFRPQQETGVSVLREMIPAEKTDRILEFPGGDAALILSMKKRTREEAFEFASAVTETMESEAGISCTAGIGRTAEHLQEIAGSFRDAEAAIETGIRHRIPGTVYDFSEQTLERLADLIPFEKAEAYRREMIPPEAEKVMTEETLETIRTFFRNDLNLSTTARELFIHRNTLLYRMEKVRKATGLDLRKFEDAAVFRILMDFQ